MMIPGARKSDLMSFGDTLKASHFCGNEKGLGSKKDGDAAKTVCSKIVFDAIIISLPKHRKIIFYSNEMSVMFLIIKFQQHEHHSLYNFFRIILK